MGQWVKWVTIFNGRWVMGRQMGHEFQWVSGSWVSRLNGSQVSVGQWIFDQWVKWVTILMGQWVTGQMGHFP